MPEALIEVDSQIKSVEGRHFRLSAFAEELSALLIRDRARHEDVSRWIRAAAASEWGSAPLLACEALMRAYAHLFGIHGLAFRFANVVGPRQTHGVAYDFVRRLRRDPSRLKILGDGRQSKSYVHVDDVVGAVVMVLDQGWTGFEAYNLAPDDVVTVRRIADLCVEAVVGGPVEYEFAGGDRGWKGDVPVVRFDTSRLRGRGWRPVRNSTEALTDAIASLLEDDRAGRFDHDR